MPVLFFLVSIGLVPLGQLFSHIPEWYRGLESRTPACPETIGSSDPLEIHGKERMRPADRILQENRRLLEKIHGVEGWLEESFFFRRALIDFLRPIYRRLGVAGENALIGQDGWLYYEKDVRLLTHSSRDLASAESRSIESILDFHRQLAARDIALMVVPIPSKAALEPEFLWKGFSNRQTPLLPPWYAQWVEELLRRGVTVLDVHPFLLARKQQTSAHQYLKTDTHWTPDAMEAVAREIAGRVREIRPTGAVTFVQKERTVTNHGDIAAMIHPGRSRVEWEPETVTIHEILGPEGELWRENPSAGILLVGDSFSNIYSMESMNWGRSGGLAEMLSYYLREPIDRIVQNDAGAISGRRFLSRELAAGKDRLAGKKLIIWQFAARELTYGDWSPIELKTGIPGESPFLTPNSGESWIVSGTVASISSVPSPGSVPYADHIASLHVMDIRSGNPSLNSGQALVYIQSMRENRLTAAAGLRIGDRICLRLRAWSDVEERMGGFNRSEPEDDDLMFAQPFWGELVREND